MSGTSEAKKLVSVLAIFTWTTGTREEALKRVFYIYYPVQFKKNKTQVQALIDLGSEVNIIYLSFAKQLGLLIKSTSIRVPKIDGTTLDTIAAFSVVDKANQVRFFEMTFLVANVSLKVVLGMLFLILSSADVDFSDRKLW